MAGCPNLLSRFKRSGVGNIQDKLLSGQTYNLLTMVQFIQKININVT